MVRRSARQHSLQNFKPQHSRLEPQDSHFKPEHSCLEPQRSHFKLEHSRLEPQDSRFKLENSCFKPQRSRFKPEHSRLEPQDSRFKLKNSRFKAISSPFPFPRVSVLSLTSINIITEMAIVITQINIGILQIRLQPITTPHQQLI